MPFLRNSRDVQPNLRCYDAILSKIDAYGAVRNRTYHGAGDELRSRPYPGKEHRVGVTWDAPRFLEE